MEGRRRRRKQPSRKMEHTGAGGGEILKEELGESGLWLDLWKLPFPPSLSAGYCRPPGGLSPPEPTQGYNNEAQVLSAGSHARLRDDAGFPASWASEAGGQRWRSELTAPPGPARNRRSRAAPANQKPQSWATILNMAGKFGFFFLGVISLKVSFFTFCVVFFFK